MQQDWRTLNYTLSYEDIRSSEKFLSFYKEMNAHFSFYIILSNYVFCSIEINITMFDGLGFMFV